METDKILTIIIISTIVSYFSYFFWNKNIDKLIQVKLNILKDEILKNSELINRKLKRMETQLQKDRYKDFNTTPRKIKKESSKNVNRNS